MTPVSASLRQDRSRRPAHPDRVRQTTAAILIMQRAPLEVAMVEIPELGVGQVLVTPSQRYGAQTGLPTDPSGTALQVPKLPAKLQASQASAQVLLQQRPFTHKPL